MTIQAKVSLQSVFQGLDNLKKVTEPLARSMAVAGGKIVRDEAKARAPVDDGTLRDSIYLAYRDAKSKGPTVMYSITWNSRTAPHGHLLEFGHWQTRAAFKGADGQWRSGAELANPRWVAAHPFLRPAWEATQARVQIAMLERGRERLPELLRDLYTPAEADFV